MFLEELGQIRECPPGKHNSIVMRPGSFFFPSSYSCHMAPRLDFNNNKNGDNHVVPSGVAASLENICPNTWKKLQNRGGKRGSETARSVHDLYFATNSVTDRTYILTLKMSCDGKHKKLSCLHEGSSKEGGALGEEAAEGDSDWDTGYRVQGGLGPGSDRSALLNRNVCQEDCNERIWFLLGCHGDYGTVFPLDSRGGCLM